MLRLTAVLAAFLLAVIAGSAGAAEDGQSVSAQVQEQRGPADRGDGDGGGDDDQGRQDDETGGGDDTGGQDDETVEGRDEAPEGDDEGEGDVLGEGKESDPGAGGDGGTNADDVAEEDDGGSLPFTGLEIALIALSGALLLLLGVAVRERARRSG